MPKPGTFRIIYYERKPACLTKPEWELFQDISDLALADYTVAQMARELGVRQTEIRRVQHLIQQDADRIWREQDRAKEVERFKRNQIHPFDYAHA